MQELIQSSELVLQLLMRVVALAVWGWVVYTMLRALPMMLDNRSVRLRNLLVAGAIVLAVLVAIIFVPKLSIEAMNESYDKAMPEINVLIDKVVSDVREGYEPEITVEDLPTAVPLSPTPVQVVVTATPDPNAGGGLPGPSVTPLPTIEQPTFTPEPTATPTVEPTFDYSTWNPATPAPTPEIWQGG